MKFSEFIENKELCENLTRFFKKVCNLDHILSIYLFGSVARKESTTDSDLDILIITENNFAKKIEQLVLSQDYYNLDKSVINFLSKGLQFLILDSNTIEDSFDTLINKILIEGQLICGKSISECLDTEKFKIGEKPHPKYFLDELKKIVISF